VLAGLLAATVCTPAAQGQQVKLRFGHDQPVGSMYDEGHAVLRTLLEERTAGRLKMQIFPAAQLGSEVAMIEGVRLGSLDGAVAHVANASTVVPELALFSVSYLFRDGEHFERVIDDPRFMSRIDSLVSSKKLGVRVIGYYSAGVRTLYTRKGPVTTPADLKGTRIRVMNNPVEARVWRTLGAIPTPMNFGEVYQALQTGVLHAAENAPAVIESTRHYEAARTIVLTDHQHGLALLLMNERRLDGLTPDLRQIVFKSAQEASQRERRRDAELNAQAIEKMKTRGAQIVVPERRQFAALMMPIQDEVAAELKMTDVLALIRQHAR
jgi:tripartite ATP-independent transporter DctP family solute receptor